MPRYLPIFVVDARADTRRRDEKFEPQDALSEAQLLVAFWFDWWMKNIIIIMGHVPLRFRLTQKIFPWFHWWAHRGTAALPSVVILCGGRAFLVRFTIISLSA